MKRNKICIYLFAIAFLMGLFFSACKKYPENKGIHLTNPKKRLINNKAIITLYNINGDDSLSLLTEQFGQDIKTIHWEWGDQYTPEYFYETTLTSGGGEIGFDHTCKNMSILYYPKYYNYPALKLGYNIFSTQGSVWKILKFYQKNKKTTLKLKREYNGKTYIIQFN